MTFSTKHPAALLIGALVALGTAGRAGAEPLRCPSPSELAELAQGFGTGGDSLRRAYVYFGNRFGRAASLSQRENESEVSYGAGRGEIRFALRRDPSTGLVSMTCR